MQPAPVKQQKHMNPRSNNKQPFSISKYLLLAILFYKWMLKVSLENDS